MSYSGITPYGSAYREPPQPQEQQAEQQRRVSEPKGYRPYQPYRPPTQQPGPSDSRENGSRRSSIASQLSLASSLAKLDLGDSSMVPAPLRLQHRPVSCKTPQSPQTEQNYKPYSPPSSQHRNSVISTAGRRTSSSFVAELEGSLPPPGRASNAVQPSSNVPPPKPAKILETPDSEGLIVVEAEASPSAPGSWPTSHEEQSDTGYQPPYTQPQYQTPISPLSPHHEVTNPTPSPPPVQYPSAFQQPAPTTPPVPQPTYTFAPAQPGYQSFSPPQSPPLPPSGKTPAPFTPQSHQPGNYKSTPSTVYNQALTAPVGQAPPPPPYQPLTYGSPPHSPPPPPPPPPPQSMRPTSLYFSDYQCPPTPTLTTSNLPLTPPTQQGPFSPASPQSPTAGSHRHSISYFPAAYPPRPSPPTQHQPATTLPFPSSPFPIPPVPNTSTFQHSPSMPTPSSQQPQQPTITYTTAPSQPTYSSPSFSSSSLSTSAANNNKPGGALYNFPSPPLPILNSKLSINGLKRTAAGLGGAIKNVANVVEVAGREAVKAGKAAAANGGRDYGRESGSFGRRVSGMGFYGGGGLGGGRG